MQTFTYQGSATTALPVLVLRWQYESAAGTFTDLDLSGYTFSLTLEDTDGATQLTKTSNITGGTGTVTVQWVAGDLDLTAGVYRLHLAATSGGVARHYSPHNPITLRIV